MLMTFGCAELRLLSAFAPGDWRRVERLVVEWSFTKQRSLDVFLAAVARLEAEGFAVWYAGLWIFCLLFAYSSLLIAPPLDSRAAAAGRPAALRLDACLAPSNLLLLYPASQVRGPRQLGGQPGRVAVARRRPSLCRAGGT